MREAINQFRDAIRSAGLIPPDMIEPGKFHKFPGEGKRNGNTAAWCKLFPDGIGGIYGDYSTGLTTNWQASREAPYSQAERAAFKRHIAEAKAQAEAERKAKQAEAAKQTATIWQGAQPAPADHAYLARKGIKPHGARLHNGALLIPMREGGELHSLQFIGPDGDKRFLTGGRVVGCYYSIGNPKGAAALCIAEGFATGATIHEATGYPVAVAFNAGNLEPVARALRVKLPELRLIVCGDDDVASEGNPGLTKATAAARSVGGLVAIPDFGGNRPEGASDFNDMAAQCGKEAVARAVAGAIESARAEYQPDTASAPAGDPAGAEWPEPLPLPTLPSVPAFDFSLLPDKFAPWVADAAERARFAPDFAAVSAMVAFGSLVGRRLGIRLKAADDWTEYANVWGALIGLPSSLKTPAMRDAMSPFKRLQFAADADDAKARLIFDAELELAKIRNDAAKKAAKNALAENPDAKLDLVLEALPGAPPCRVYWTSDATVERLGEILAENPNGLLVERDELSSLLTNLEDERNATARGFYLTGWSGKEGYRFDRIQRGKTAIQAFALSVIGGIQPGPLERYVRGAFSGERADGLLQRFQLAVWPDAAAFEYVDRWPSKVDKDAAADLFKFADSLDPERIGQRENFGDSPPFLRLDAAAQGLFVEWYTSFMTTRRNRETSGEDCSAVSSHFGKYPGLLGKLALILHIADEPTARAVGKRTILKALAWLEYLEPHARRVYHGADAPDADTARLLLARIKRGQVQSPLKAREIYRNGWHGLGDAKRVKAACRLLADFDYLRAIEIDKPVIGRPSDPLYYVNPKVTR